MPMKFPSPRTSSALPPCHPQDQKCFSYFFIFKRGVVGTFHKVSAKYLPPYVAEFECHYNNRKNADIFGAAVAKC